MSAGKLDQSLDEILSTQRQRRAHGDRHARRSTGAATSKSTPVGGIRKNTKSVRNATKATPSKSVGTIGESKIIVSNMPKDVSESQIKEYFQKAVGQVKKVELTYGPGGASRGIANVVFVHADGASKAFAKLNGLLIDGRPVKVEVVVASAELIPQPMNLSQRISQPKAQPKSVAADKQGINGARSAGVGRVGRRGVGRRSRPSRPVKKTAEELDSEMADYFDTANMNHTTEGNNNPNTNSAAPTGNGDAVMEDEIL